MRISDWSSDVCSSDLAGQLNLSSLDRVPVQLELEDGTLYGISGHIDFLDLAIDEETGTAALRAEFPNPGRLLLPGQFVRARIAAGTQADGIIVPQRAVTVSPQGGTVMVVGAKNIDRKSQGRRGGKECVSTGRARLWPDN